MTRSAAAISAGVRVFCAPTEPWVSNSGRVAERLGALFDAFGGHESVGDAGRAGGHGDHLLAAGRGGEGAAERGGGVGEHGVEGRARRRLAREPRVVFDVADQQDRFGGGDGVGGESAGDGVAGLHFDGERMTERCRRLLQRFGGEHRLGGAVGRGDHRYQLRHGFPSS